MIELDFSKANGLVPAIAQDYKTNEVLMLAYMNKQAWELTLKTGLAHYWSRTRQEIWKKGETSGNIQKVKEIRLDCYHNAVLLKIHQVGDAACHTGYRSCFFSLVKNDKIIIDGQKIFDPKDKYGEKDE